MKIAILTSGTQPVPAVRGGAVETLIDFCLEYNEQHQLHDITVYSVWHPDVENSTALKSDVNHYCFIKVHSLWAKLQKRLYKKVHGKEYYHYTIEYFFERAYSRMRKENYDLILVENRPGYLIKLGKRTRSRLIIHQENDYLNSDTRRYQEIYDAASVVINTSEYITQRVKTINPQDEKSRTVLNGIDTSRFYNYQAGNRTTVGLKETDFVIVYSGRLTKEKGILELLKAIRQIDSIPNLKLLIIGASAYGKDKEPTPFIRQLEEMAEPIRESVVFTGFVSYGNVPAYLKMGDVAVVPSMWEEPFGLTVVEAMAVGLPLVTTRSGGIPEICEGVASIVERDGIVGNLTAAITYLYEHPEKREAMSRASIERSKYFSKERYAREFFETISNI